MLSYMFICFSLRIMTMISRPLYNRKFGIPKRSDKTDLASGFYSFFFFDINLFRVSNLPFPDAQCMVYLATFGLFRG